MICLHTSCRIRAYDVKFLERRNYSSITMPDHWDRHFYHGLYSRYALHFMMTIIQSRKRRVMCLRSRVCLDAPKPHPRISKLDARGRPIKFANLILEGLFTMNLYQLDKQSTRFTIGKYWNGCVKKLDGNDPKFCKQPMDLATRQCTCSHGTVCEGVFS